MGAPVPVVRERRGRHLYSVFGLTLASDLPLPELYPAKASGAAVDIEIVLGDIPIDPVSAPEGLSMHQAGALLTVADAGRYLISDGRRILIEARPDGSERHLRLYLLGSAMGVVLHQRHLLPLHANAIEVSGRAIAFMGASGAGKSTMAAWFHDRGCTVLADDVCVVTSSKSGEPIAQPGIPRLRLWRDALESSGRDADAFEHAFDDADKYNVPTEGDRAGRPLPLGAIYLLDAPESDADKQAITRLTGIDAMDALVSNVYRGGYAPMLGALPSLIAVCRTLAGQVPVFSVRRVWGRERLDVELSALERHAQAVVAKSRSGRPDVDQAGVQQLV